MSEKGSRRAVFGSKFAAIATTVGSAVGLGNIWRFPYEAGMHGGGAFVLCYLVFAFLIGVPVLIAEFVMGRGTRSNVLGAFRKLDPKHPWYWTGYIGIFASTLIIGFYTVVAGWTLEYCIESLCGSLDFSSAEQGHSQFVALTTGWRTVLWTAIFALCNYLILMRGVTKGIERLSNILMPVLFLLMVIFCVHSFFLPGFDKGCSFIFKPDFSKITPSVLLGAMGQAFFSLSIGIGCMTTYASYFSDKTRLGQTAVITMLLDSAVAILSAIIIFPAVFSYGLSPTAGPTLVFEVLPNIFYRMPGGAVWSTLFFLLLFLASITSTISMSEISISYLAEEKKFGRKLATTLSCGFTLVLSVLCAFSLDPDSRLSLFSMNIFNLFDYVASNIIMPLGGMVFSMYVGWWLDRNYLRDQLTDFGTHKFVMIRPLVFFLRWICPAAIFLIFLDSTGLL